MGAEVIDIIVRSGRVGDEIVQRRFDRRPCGPVGGVEGGGREEFGVVA